MAVKIIIKRKVPKGKENDLLPLLLKLRALATAEPGYISGETLRNLESPEEFLVISTWQSADHWNQWVQNPKRQEIQKQIDGILGSHTEYGIYLHG